MEELLPRSEAIKHLRHHGRKDPNLYIYSQYLENGLVEKAARFLNYRQTWEKVRREGKPPASPPHVAIALNNSCNLSCAHCYRTFNKSSSAKNSLTMEEVRKLVDECKEIGVYSIGLGTESEMYLYKGIRDVIDYISAKDFDDFWICTNGLMLNDSHIKQILESNVTRLSISLDAISPETFEKTRGKGFYRLMSNIFAFLDKREKKKLKLPVFRVTCIESNLTKHEIERFVEFWSGIAEEVDVQPLINVKNIGLLPYDRVDNPYCSYPHSMLYINWNGDYKPCCSEFCKYLTVGNIAEMSIKDAWNSSFMNDLRRQFSDGIINRYCVNCLGSLRSDELYEPVKQNH